ncbi:type IV secretion system protein [Bartonella sp. B30(2025)]
MRKLIVTVVISAFLGTPSLAVGQKRSGFSDSRGSYPSSPKYRKYPLGNGMMGGNSLGGVPSRFSGPKSKVPDSGNSISDLQDSTKQIRNDILAQGILPEIDYSKLGGSYGLNVDYRHQFSPTAPKSDSKANLPKEQLEVAKQQLQQLENVYGSLMASHHKQKKLAMLGNDSDLFFKNPQSIYDQAKIDSKISGLFKSVEQKNKLQDDSAISMREAIRARSKYAAEMDQTVSLRVFEETENRFKKINELLAQAEKTGNLKDAADLQAKIVGTLTMIQNEATKLQMILHQRNAERILIDQQKLTRNVKILSSHNLSMPTIRHTSPR